MADFIDNINMLQPTGFRLTISREFYPNLTYFANTVSHPSVETSGTKVPFSRVDINLPADKIQYGTVTFDLLMDEDMESYKEVYDWQKRQVETNHRPQSARFSSQFGDQPIPTSSNDIVLSILTSSLNSNRQIIYRNALPVSLGNIAMSTSATEYITFPVTFSFDYFDFV
jgi:hypothetical protein